MGVGYCRGGLLFAIRNDHDPDGDGALVDPERAYEWHGLGLEPLRSSPPSAAALAFAQDVHIPAPPFPVGSWGTVRHWDQEGRGQHVGGLADRVGLFEDEWTEEEVADFQKQLIGLIEEERMNVGGRNVSDADADDLLRGSSGGWSNEDWRGEEDEDDAGGSKGVGLRASSSPAGEDSTLSWLQKPWQKDFDLSINDGNPLGEDLSINDGNPLGGSSFAQASTTWQTTAPPRAPPNPTELQSAEKCLIYGTDKAAVANSRERMDERLTPRVVKMSLGAVAGKQTKLLGPAANVVLQAIRDSHTSVDIRPATAPPIPPPPPPFIVQPREFDTNVTTCPKIEEHHIRPEEYPVDMTWDNATMLAHKRGGRIPTTEEWKKLIETTGEVKEWAGNTSEIFTPRPITPTFGCAKEKLRRTRRVRGFTTSAETSPGGVPWRRLVGGGA